MELIIVVKILIFKFKKREITFVSPQMLGV